MRDIRSFEQNVFRNRDQTPKRSLCSVAVADTVGNSVPPPQYSMQYSSTEAAT
eukprot:gene20221-26973_t